MAGFDRAELIGGLAAEFDKAKGLNVKIDKTNYIDSTNSLDCSALGLPLDTLQKTKNVAQLYMNALKDDARNNPESAQKVIYMEVAIKCIDEVIGLKSKNK